MVRGNYDWLSPHSKRNGGLGGFIGRAAEDNPEPPGGP